MKFLMVLYFFVPFLAFASPEVEVKYVLGEVRSVNGPLRVGQKLNFGETISTGKASAVRILFSDGIATQLGPESEMRIEHKANQPTTIELFRGYLASRIKPLVTKGPRFEVKAKGVSMGVRGTTFFTKVEKNGAFLCVCEGSVFVKWAKGSETVVAKHHEVPKSFDVSQLKSKPLTDMGNEHSDEGIAELQKLLD